MEPNWFGMMMVLGFIFAGTLIFVLTYKVLAVLARLAFPKRFKETPASENATPIDIIFGLLGGLLPLVLAVYVATAERKLGSAGVAITILLSAFAIGFYAEKKIRSNESIKDSWWCTPLGVRSDQESR